MHVDFRLGENLHLGCGCGFRGMGVVRVRRFRGMERCAVEGEGDGSLELKRQIDFRLLDLMNEV